MGDHSKAGINTMFNTATVVGVGVNIHGSGFPRNFVASFLEGSCRLQRSFNDKILCYSTSGYGSSRPELGEADERMFYAIREAAESYK